MKTLRTASEGACEWDGVWVNIVTLSKQRPRHRPPLWCSTPFGLEYQKTNFLGQSLDTLSQKSITHILNLIFSPLLWYLLLIPQSSLNLNHSVGISEPEHYHYNAMCSRGDLDLDVNSDTWAAAHLAKSTKLLRYIGWSKAIHSHWTYVTHLKLIMLHNFDCDDKS